MRLSYILRISENGFLSAFVAYDIPSHYAPIIARPSQLSNRISKNPLDGRRKAVYVRGMMKFVKWVGEWLFVIFVLLPLLLVSLCLWKKELKDHD
jgi:hypothetical protein